MKHISEVHIRYGDIDAMGHVNNVVYLQYFEQARMSWFKKLLGTDWDWNSVGVVLARNEIDYRLPLFLHERPVIKTTVEHVGETSVTLKYQVIKTENGKRLLVATGKSVLVCFDNKTQKPEAVPKAWIERIIIE